MSVLRAKATIFMLQTSSKQLRKQLKFVLKGWKVNKRKLRLAIMDMEKTQGFYRKELDRWKTRQIKWINEQEIKFVIILSHLVLNVVLTHSLERTSVS